MTNTIALDFLDDLDLFTSFEPPPPAALPSSPHEQFARLLSQLFDPDDCILIRPIESWAKAGKKQSRTIWGQTKCRALKAISSVTFDRLERIGERFLANIFFGVCPRFGSDGYDFAWQIRTVRCLWSDIDDVPPDDAVARCLANGLPKPSIIVGSGTHGAHLYWLLSAPYLIDDVGDPPRALKEWVEIDGRKRAVHYYSDSATGARRYLDDPTTGDKLEHPDLSPKAARIRRILQGIAATIHGDHTIDLTRLLRLPGTMNRKDQRNGREPRPCVLLECSGERYDLEQFQRFAEVEIPRPSVKRNDRGLNGHAGGHTANGWHPTDADIDAKIRDSKQGAKYDRLMAGSTAEYDSDESRADEALCSILAYWTRDPETIDRLFRRSSLCDEKWTSRADYRSSTIGRALELVTESYDWTRGKLAPAIAVPVGDRHTLQVLNERRTPGGKLVIAGMLTEAGKPVVRVEVTSSVSGQKDAVRKIKKYLGEDSEIDAEAVIDNILTDAQGRLDKAAAGQQGEDGETVREIVARVVPPMFALHHRLPSGGAWSERLGREVKRPEFTSHVPGSLLDQAAAATNAPINQNTGAIDDMKLLQAVEGALRVTWSTLMESLPMQAADAADLDEKSTAGQKFLADVFRVWTNPALFKNVAVSKDETGVTRASLASLVADLFRQFVEAKVTIEGRQRWLEIKTSIPAWYRPYCDDEGMIRVALAMRFNLFDAIRIPCDWATNQDSFRKLGRQCGAFTDINGVRSRLTDGTRLAVLSASLTDQILAKPTEATFEDDEDDPQPGIPANESCFADTTDNNGGNFTVRE